MQALAYCFGLLAIFGMIYCVVAWGAVAAFTGTRSSRPGSRPPVTILKPLHGDEPLLTEALRSFFAQDYPVFQIVFGVQRLDDPALSIVDRLSAQFPDRDVAVIIDPTVHGPNRKVGNLINMLPAARHDLLIIADSDLHVRPDYIDSVVAKLLQDGTGLVTTLYTGLAVPGSLLTPLAATQITHSFLPGVLVSRLMGRQDCLGVTMALRRRTLDAIGGLPAVVRHLADDNVLGRLVVEHGLAVRLADTVTAVTVPESSARALWQHEIRWARTNRALAPLAFAASSIQFPMFWAMLAIALSGGATWSVVLAAAAWLARGASACAVDRTLATRNWLLAGHAPVWLVPCRDLLSVAEIAASFLSDRVVWRGHAMFADSGVPAPCRRDGGGGPLADQSGSQLG